MASSKIEQFFQMGRKTNCLDVILAFNVICASISALLKNERRLFQLCFVEYRAETLKRNVQALNLSKIYGTSYLTFSQSPKDSA